MVRVIQKKKVKNKLKSGGINKDLTSSESESDYDFDQDVKSPKVEVGYNRKGRTKKPNNNVLEKDINGKNRKSYLNSVFSSSDESVKESDSDSGTDRNEKSDATGSKNNYKKNKSSSEEKRYLSKKQQLKKVMSARKSRIKQKFAKAIELVNKLKKQTIPLSIQETIKGNKIYTQKLNDLEQRTCFDFFSSLSKEEIVIILLLFPGTNAELAFTKEDIFSKKYLEIMFNDLNLDTII